MAGRGRVADGRARATRVWTVVVIWVAGLAAGFFGLLSAAARYGCGAGDSGFGCSAAGSAVGVVITVAVVAVVTAVTILTHDRDQHRVLVLGAAGIVTLAVCFAAARVLLDTV